jgi:transposase-like protein
MRKQFTAQQKATVALAALSGDKSVNQVASTNDVHPTQVKQWRAVVKEKAPQLFMDQRTKDMSGATMQAKIDELHRVIGVRDAELEWLKKKTAGLAN